MRKLCALSTGCVSRRLRTYTRHYKQLPPMNSLTFYRVMSCLMAGWCTGPSHCRCICLKHKVAILRLKWKVAIYRILTMCMGTGTMWQQLCVADLEWSTGALWHNKGSLSWGPSERQWCIETWQPASWHGHCDSMMSGHQDLNFKVGKMIYCLGNPDPDWAKCSKSGQNFSRSGPSG